MIGGSGKVNSGNYHKHEVTKCIHESGAAKIEDGGKMRAGMNASSSLIRQERKTFSLQEWLTDGMRDLLSRVSGFWRRMGEEGTGDRNELAAEDRRGSGSAARVTGEAKNIVSPASDVSAAVMSTAMIRTETEKKETEEETERRVENIEGAVGGGLKKEQGGIRKFRRKFEETAAKAGQFLKRKKKMESGLAESEADFNIGDNSFLLDSYNREGEYSTLAKDRSLEGSFRAKG